MKFLVCKKQGGEGCDYSIGCGMRFDWVEADSLAQAADNAVWPNGKDERSSLEGDMGLSEIMIIPQEHVHIVDVPAIDVRIEAAARDKELQKQEKRERAQLARLQKKYST